MATPPDARESAAPAAPPLPSPADLELAERFRQSGRRLIADIHKVMKKVLRRQKELNLDREHFWVMGLDIHQWILYLELVSLGTVDATLVDPMSVFSFALQKSASNIVMIHNHPSDQLVPAGAMSSAALVKQSASTNGACQSS